MQFVACAATDRTKPLPPDMAKDIIISYQRAILLQKEAAEEEAAADATKQQFTNAIEDFKQLSARTAKKRGLPEGTDFRVDWSTGVVTPVLPPARPSAAKPKAEVKK